MMELTWKIVMLTDGVEVLVCSSQDKGVLLNPSVENIALQLYDCGYMLGVKHVALDELITAEAMLAATSVNAKSGFSAHKGSAAAFTVDSYAELAAILSERYRNAIITTAITDPTSNGLKAFYDACTSSASIAPKACGQGVSCLDTSKITVSQAFTRLLFDASMVNNFLSNRKYFSRVEYFIENSKYYRFSPYKGALTALASFEEANEWYGLGLSGDDIYYSYGHLGLSDDVGLCLSKVADLISSDQTKEGLIASCQNFVKTVKDTDIDQELVAQKGN